MASIFATFPGESSPVRPRPVHTRDEHCSLDHDDQCIDCGVSHEIECSECGGRGFHREECSESEPDTWPCVVCDVARVVAGEGYCDDDGPKCDACYGQRLTRGDYLARRAAG